MQFVSFLFVYLLLFYKELLYSGNGDSDTEGIATQDISIASSLPSSAPPPMTTTRVQLMFDFHRLNILLLRAVLKDNIMIGRKIATATMSQAKINATVGLLYFMSNDHNCRIVINFIHTHVSLLRS